MAHRLGAAISRDRRRIEAEEADLLAEADRVRERLERQERQERQQQPQEVVFRLERDDRPPYERFRRAEVDVYEPRRDRYGRYTESAALRELRLREEEDAYLRERQLARAVVEAREELRNAVPISMPPRRREATPPRRREARPLIDLDIHYDYGRREEIPRLREPIYTHVANPRYREELRRMPRDASYEEMLYEDEIGVPMYDDDLMEEARIRREADQYARIMAQRREDEYWDDMQRRL